MSTVSGRGGIREDMTADLALMERIVARDATAIAELYDRHSSLLYGLILRILKQRGDAEEVLQEVFVAVWLRAASFNSDLGPPVAWLLRIARNRALDRLRANTVRQRTAESAVTLDAPAETPEARAVRIEQQDAMRDALDALPAEQRLLIEEAYFLGLTQSELAAKHGLPLGTVKTRVRTGMLSLRERLAQVQVKA